MRSLDIIKASKNKTSWRERIVYFDKLLTDYNKQVIENFTKQTRIDNRDELIIYQDSKIKELEEKLKNLSKENEKLIKKYNSEKEEIKEKLKEIEELNQKINFLKNNKRAPSIEELKDYQYKRKRSVSKC